MSKQLSEEMLVTLRKLALRRDVIPEEDTVDDYAGGNVDDAYSLGFEHGEAALAKAVLASVEE